MANHERGENLCHRSQCVGLFRSSIGNIRDQRATTPRQQHGSMQPESRINMCGALTRMSLVKREKRSHLSYLSHGTKSTYSDVKSHKATEDPEIILFHRILFVNARLCNATGILRTIQPPRTPPFYQFQLLTHTHQCAPTRAIITFM